MKNEYIKNLRKLFVSIMRKKVGKRSHGRPYDSTKHETTTNPTEEAKRKIIKTKLDCKLEDERTTREGRRKWRIFPFNQN